MMAIDKNLWPPCITYVIKAAREDIEDDSEDRGRDLWVWLGNAEKRAAEMGSALWVAQHYDEAEAWEALEEQISAVAVAVGYFGIGGPGHSLGKVIWQWQEHYRAQS